jgi:hypothetical protein
MKPSNLVVADKDAREASREEMFMLPGLSFSGFSIPLHDRRWSIDRT